jgi:hypothetical protein
MSAPRLKIYGSVLLALLLAALLWKGNPESRPAAGEAADGERHGAGEFAVYAPESVHLPSASIEMPKAVEGAIPGEYTIFFTDEAALGNFIAANDGSGVRVLGVIPEFLAVRVSASAASLQPLLREGMTVGQNVAVSAPPIPDIDFWQDSNLRAFNAEVMGFLGAPSAVERLSWGEGVTIAVLDTGWADHESVPAGKVRVLDLVGSAGQGEFSGHGTAVIGMVVSNDPFAPGISPGSDILAVRVLDAAGQGDAFTLAQGILAAVEAGADVINMSLGSYGDSQVLREAIHFAHEQGVVMVAASGNDGQGRVTYPAAYDNVIGVSAVDAEGNRTPFSNYGEGIDLAAPGYHLHALWDNDTYIYFDGTSASAPLVSGMAARILQSGVATTPDDVTALLLQQANETGLPGDDIQYGAGILNVQRIEDSGKSGISDLALADLYPAVEQSDGTTFPLYATIENRGTEYLPMATVELSINGTPYFYRFTGLVPGEVDSVQFPVPIAELEQGASFSITAKAVLPERLTDSRPANDAGNITLKKAPPD